MTLQAILGFNSIVLTTTLLSGRFQSKPIKAVEPEIQTIDSQLGEECGFINEDPSNPGYASDMVYCAYGLKCLDPNGNLTVISGLCEKMLESDYNDYDMADLYGDTYENTVQTIYNQTIDDFESEPRKCHSSRKALVQFETENYSIEWAPNCDIDIPELFYPDQCGYDSQDDSQFLCWCADTTSGKRLSDVKLGSLFNASTCE